MHVWCTHWCFKDIVVSRFVLGRLRATAQNYDGIKRDADMSARDLYTAPPNEYLIQRPVQKFTNHELLTVFYTHVLELTRLLQASQVPQDLDPVEIARSEDRWSWSASLPMQVEKLWADLQAVRKRVAPSLAANARAAAERAEGKDAKDVPSSGNQEADKHLVEGCMHLYDTMDAVVQHVTPHLAGMFVFRLVEIADHLDEEFVQRIPVLSRDAEVATNIRRAWQAGAYQRALAKYFTAQIAEELHALRAAEPRVRSRL
jgi:hypothetical protein